MERMAILPPSLFKLVNGALAPQLQTPRRFLTVLHRLVGGIGTYHDDRLTFILVMLTI